MSYPKYLDTSAAIKLVLNEGHSAELRQYFRPRTNFVMTPFCFYESLTILKSRWVGRKNSAGMINKISEQEYHNAAYMLLDYVADKKIEVVDDLKLSDRNVRPEVERLSRKHRLDISDSLQLLTILKGRYRNFVDESRPLFISVDGTLVEAAISEGIQRIWHLSDPRTKPSE